MDIRQVDAAEDPILVAHYLALWDSYGTPPEHYRADAAAAVQGFIDTARAGEQLGVFIAYGGDHPIGSAACNRYRPPFPVVLKPEVVTQGYIWSVYVEPEHCGQGVAKALTRRALEHLRAIGCTGAVLNSSEVAKSLYLNLGFAVGSQMRLVFADHW